MKEKGKGGLRRPRYSTWFWLIVGMVMAAFPFYPQVTVYNGAMVIWSVTSLGAALAIYHSYRLLYYNAAGELRPFEGQIRQNPDDPSLMEQYIQERWIDALHHKPIMLSPRHRTIASVKIFVGLVLAAISILVLGHTELSIKWFGWNIYASSVLPLLLGSGLFGSGIATLGSYDRSGQAWPFKAQLRYHPDNPEIIQQYSELGWVDKIGPHIKLNDGWNYRTTSLRPHPQNPDIIQQCDDRGLWQDVFDRRLASGETPAPDETV